MSDVRQMVSETATQLFGRGVTHDLLLRAEEGIWPTSLWQEVEDCGLPQALVPENAGGFGLEAVDALELIRLAGRFALPLPLGETMLARWLLSRAGLAIPEGPLALVPDGTDLRLTEAGGDWRIEGSAEAVPWGRNAVAAVALVEGGGGARLVLVPPAAYAVTLGSNLALEARDQLRFGGALTAAEVAAVSEDALGLRLAGAALRSLALAGAMERILEMTVDYANQRQQFGRPIGKFQAIQQNLAVLAGQAVAAKGAADLAAEGFGQEGGALQIAAAKVRGGEAAGKVAAIAHQIHGAIGFTREHGLHLLTKRLWSWREEFGNERSWSDWIGKQALAAGPEGYWPLLTAGRVGLGA